jgi:MSHA pilin protein MshD
MRIYLNKKGFTFIELIVTVVMIGIAILALVMVFQEALKNLDRQRQMRLSYLLAEDQMNEIRSKKYADPQSPTNFGPEEASRRDYDDVDDYDGYAEAPPRTIEGVTLTNLPSGFSWRAIVVNVQGTDFNFNGPAAADNSTDFKRITVVVSNIAVIISNMSVVSRYD